MLVATASMNSRMQHGVIINASHNTLSHPPAVWLFLLPLPRCFLLGSDVNVLFGGEHSSLPYSQLFGQLKVSALVMGEAKSGAYLEMQT